MKFAFADIRSQCTELTAATARTPIQIRKKPTLSSACAGHFKNARLLTLSSLLKYFVFEIFSPQFWVYAALYLVKEESPRTGSSPEQHTWWRHRSSPQL